MPSTSRTTSVLTSRSTTRSTSHSTTTTFTTGAPKTTTYTTTFQTSRATSRTTTYNSYFNTSHVTTYTTSWAVSTSRQTSNSTTSAFNTTYYTTLSANTTVYTNTNTVVNTPVTTYSVTTTAPAYRSTTFYRPPQVSETNLMLNLDARVSAGSSTWKDQSGNSRDATISGTMGISDRCEALYNFHSDATDLTGNYTGTETDVTYASGNYGQGAVFNGSTSVIDTNNVFSNNVSKITYSAWAYFDNLNTQNFIMFPDSSTTGYGFGFFDYGNGNLYFQSDNTTNSNRGYISNSGLYNTGEWVHFALVFDGTATGNSDRLKAYVNSNLLTLTFQGTIPTTTKSSSYNLLIGSRKGGNSLNGKIDQVRIFNKALSSSEITSLYNENSSTFKKVDIFNDAVAGYYTLDSTDSFYTSQFITDQTFTIGGWFYRTTAGGSAGYETLWSQGFSPSVRCQVYGAAGASTGDRLYIYLHNGSTGASYNTGIDLPTAEWFHLMKTYDMSAGSVKVYLNGALKLTQSTITGNIYSAGNSDAYFRIAKNSTNANGYINGRISQVRVYDSVLTDEQVLDDYTTHDYLYT